MRDSLLCIARILLASAAALPEDVPWHELGPHHVDAILAVLAERYAPSTANRHLAALRGLIQTMVRMDLIEGARAAKLLDFKAYKNDGPLAGRVLSMAEIGALFAACADEPRDAAILALAYGGGLRRTEIAELPLEAYAGGAVRVCGKGGKVRDVPLPAAARALVERWLTQRAGDSLAPVSFPLICRVTPLGRPVGTISAAGVYAVLRTIGARAKISSYTPHDLRRTYITELLARGVDVVTAARLAGHSSTKTTMLYDRRPADVAAAAVELLNGEIPMPPPVPEARPDAS